jgi:hypothetical protein
MPELTVLTALLDQLRTSLTALRRPDRDPEAGGIISEYAVVLGVAVAAIAIIAALIVAIRGRFQAFAG